MSTARPASDRVRRAPRLLLLVFGIFLVLVGITGSALVAITSSHLVGATLNAVVEADRTRIDHFATVTLHAEDLAAPISTARQAELVEQLAALRTDEIVAIALHRGDGAVVAESGAVDEGALVSQRLTDALGGIPSAELIDGATLAEYLPLASDAGDVLGVVILVRDAAAVMRDLEAAQRDVLAITVIAATVLAAVLVLVFRAAHHRLIRQQAQLAEAARSDSLTGMLNHGSVVMLLDERIQSARPESGPVGVALVDVDNFRLFNDTHGHDAGDEVLLRVAALVSAAAGEEGVAARFGPDEFLLMCPGHEAASLVAAGEALQAELRAVSVMIGDSEELPVSVSIGVAAVPAHATSVTPLLAEASVALGEAKASGGDRVVVARVGEERGTHAGGFDVLQGLVIAVDTKDRYTKRHSEDVARYGVYLARRMGLDDLLEPVRLAGLLHDVGKIGIPDQLLRKPGRLTEAEIKIFNQHVALGDAIVRDLPDTDLVRAGIRHHHERWDGGGYLDGLKGEAIPLIARIIAVADTFSAMTTTRPYRKALSVDEALRRLREAAGTQLQPELVTAFAEGIETDPDAPAPNETSDVWLPLRVA
jgi:diguanylate cyclase (GGDEF)-like protein